MNPDPLRPLADQDISALERAAYQRGDVALAAALAAADDANREAAELHDRPTQEDLSEANKRAEDAETKAADMEEAASKAYDQLHDLRQRIEAAKRISDREEILAELAAAMDTLAAAG